MALTLADEREVDACALVVPQAQALNLMWMGIIAFMVLCILLAFTCFVLGWRCSSWWNGRIASGVVDDPADVEPPRPRPRAMRLPGRKSKFTQCNRGSIDIDNIMKLTIDAIRNELRAFGDRTDGCKVELAERLRLRRVRNDELAAWFARTEAENDESHSE